MGHSPLKDPDKAAFLFLSKVDVVNMGGAQFGLLIQALIMTALLAAIMSTASFFVSIGTSAVIRDLSGALKKEISPTKQVFWGKIFTVVIIGASILFGYTGGEMVAILGTLGWGFFVSVTLPTFTLGLLWKRTSREGVIAGLSVSIVLNLLLVILNKTGVYKTPFPYYLFLIATSMFVTTIVSFFTKSCAGDNLPEEIKPLFKL